MPRAKLSRSELDESCGFAACGEVKGNLITVRKSSRSKASKNECRIKKSVTQL